MAGGLIIRYAEAGEFPGMSAISPPAGRARAYCHGQFYSDETEIIEFDIAATVPKPVLESGRLNYDRITRITGLSET
jgi:hypothetical protein